jgi:hypothetical protein
MWYMVYGERKKEAGDRGDEGLPVADACQYHSLDLSCGSRKPTNLEKNSFFDGTKRECL